MRPQVPMHNLSKKCKKLGKGAAKKSNTKNEVRENLEEQRLCKKLNKDAN